MAHLSMWMIKTCKTRWPHVMYMKYETSGMDFGTLQRLSQENRSKLEAVTKKKIHRHETSQTLLSSKESLGGLLWSLCIWVVRPRKKTANNHSSGHCSDDLKIKMFIDVFSFLSLKCHVESQPLNYSWLVSNSQLNKKHVSCNLSLRSVPSLDPHYFLLVKIPTLAKDHVEVVQNFATPACYRPQQRFI